MIKSKRVYCECSDFLIMLVDNGRIAGILIEWALIAVFSTIGAVAVPNRSIAVFATMIAVLVEYAVAIIWTRYISEECSIGAFDGGTR